MMLKLKLTISNTPKGLLEASPFHSEVEMTARLFRNMPAASRMTLLFSFEQVVSKEMRYVVMVMAVMAVKEMLGSFGML